MRERSDAAGVYRRGGEILRRLHEIRFTAARRFEPASAGISDTAFKVRPREAQVGAWASAQSEEISSREELERAVAEVSRRFEGREVPRPAGWGAFVIRPERVEFWQERVSRLHDRLEYVREGAGSGGWRVRRLSP